MYSYNQSSSILKSRDITLPTNVHLVKAMVFPVVMYGCESWTVKKAECRRIDAFELCCWRRLLQVPWTARRSSQSILKEITPGCSLVGLILKLQLQYFGPLMRRADSLKRLWHWERLRAGGEGDDRWWDGWMASPTQWTRVWVNSRSWSWTGRCAAVHGVAESWTRLSDWTELLNEILSNFLSWQIYLHNNEFLENRMAIHSNILAWRIPWMEEPGRLHSMGSQSRTRLSH